MLEWLKAILGDSYTEEIDKKISDEIGKGFVPRAELAQLRLDSAVDAALTKAGAKNFTAVRALLDLEKVSLDESGRLNGLSEQLEAVKKSDSYLFNEQEKQPFKGFQPGAAMDGVPDPAQGGYQARLANARRDNNQVEVIRIKQEAAANGIALI